jgi:hypothetical protein
VREAGKGVVTEVEVVWIRDLMDVFYPIDAGPFGWDDGRHATDARKARQGGFQVEDWA